MYKFIAAILLFSVSIFAKTIEIDSGCVYLDQISEDFPHKPVLCGLDYNEESTIHISKVAQVSGIDINTLKSKIPFKIYVKRKGVLIKEDEILAKLNDELSKRYPGYRFVIRKINYNRQIYTDSKGNFEVKLKDFPSGSSNIYVSNGVKSYRFYSYIEVYKEGYIAIDKIKKDEPLSGKYKKEFVNITNLRDKLAENLEDKLANSTILRGRPITENDIYKEPDIFKGERLKIAYIDEVITVTTVGEAQEDAYVGKKFQVKNLSSGKILTAIYKGNYFATVIY